MIHTQPESFSGLFQLGTKTKALRSLMTKQEDVSQEQWVALVPAS